jgi:hypothetical protein
MAIQNPNLAAQLAAKKKALAESIAAQAGAKVDEVKQPENEKAVSKTFYAKTAHSRFICEDGTEIMFNYGKAVITNPAHIRELLAICPPLGNNPNIFTQDAIPANLPQPKQNAVSETELNVAESNMLISNKLRVEQQTGPIVIGNADASASTIDHELLAAAGNASVIGNTQVITPVDISKVEIPGAMQSSS